MQIAAETWLLVAAGLIGAIVGAGTSLATTVLVLKGERKRQQEQWKRERQARFHHQRRDIYAAFSGAAARVVTSVQAMQRYPDKAVEHLGELLKGIGDLGDAYNRIAFVANTEVVLAAEHVRKSVGGLKDWAAPPEDYAQKYVHAIGVFNAAGRKELGLDYDLPDVLSAVLKGNEQTTGP